MTLPALWAAARARGGDSPALREGDTVLSHAALDEASARVAGRLAAAGVAAGDRVLLSGPTGLEVAVAYVALVRLGATVVPAGTGSTPRELAHLVRDARVVAAVVDNPDRVGAHRLALVTTPAVPLPDGAAPALDAATGQDLAWLAHTSGTTGAPKAVPRTHAQLAAGADAVVGAWDWTGEDTLLLSLPLHHVHGLGVGLTAGLASGGAVWLLPRFDPGLIAELAGRASMLFGVPTMYHRLLSAGVADRLAALRLVVSGSAPLPAVIFDALALHCGTPPLERYGMTETVMLASNPLAGPRKAGTVGTALPGVSLRLGEDSMVEVAGPAVFTGYAGRPRGSEWTADGYFRTGDLGEWDADGYLRLVGRASDMIITGGFNVSPREVEDVLVSHPAIADAAVVGLADPVWGQAVTAAVVVADGGGVPGDLGGYLAQRLAPHKRPKAVHALDALPRNAMGKVVRADVARQIERGPG